MLDIYKAVLPFIVLQFIALILMMVFPELITWLPYKILR